jgi:Asp/Glu/hydantoin racemase
MRPDAADGPPSGGSIPPARLIGLINPNTDSKTTSSMLRLAEAAAAEGVEVQGHTAPTGVPLITNEEALGRAAAVVATMGTSIQDSGAAGIVIGAFGDPGLYALRTTVSIPVTGIAEASMMEAALGGDFSVVTTTPLLADTIRGAARRYGCGSALRSVRITAGDTVKVMADADLLEQALAAACHEAIALDGAKSIVIGGGPLAFLAQRLRSYLPVPVIEPVGAAIRLTESRMTPAARQRRPA